VAMVLVLLGYGALAGLVPLQSGSVEASAEGPAPVAALLAGGQPAVALLLLLRLRGFPEAVAPGPLLMGLGLLALLLAAIGLWRQSDPRRVAALATAGQIGVAAFAFGLDGPTATAAGLLHLTTLLLVLPAVMFCLAFAAPTQRAVGLTLATGLAAMASLPPFGLFASAFLIATETLRLAPWLALPLGLGLVAAGWALAERVVPLCLGPAAVHRPTGLADLAAAWMMLALGAAVPLFLAGWFAPLAAGLR